MTRKGVPAMLNKRVAEAGVRHVHPHQLRQTWADRWLSAGGNDGDLHAPGRLGVCGNHAPVRRGPGRRPSLDGLRRREPDGQAVGPKRSTAGGTFASAARLGRLHRQADEVRLPRCLGPPLALVRREPPIRIDLSLERRQERRSGVARTLPTMSRAGCHGSCQKRCICARSSSRRVHTLAPGCCRQIKRVQPSGSLRLSAPVNC